MGEKESSDRCWWTVFIVYTCVLLALASFPGIFDWSNTIEPWILGMPFASFWQLLLSTLAIVGIGIYYLIENARGSLDWDVDVEDQRPGSI